MTPHTGMSGRRIAVPLTAAVALVAILLSTSNGQAAPRARQVIVSGQADETLDLRGMSGDGRYILYAYEDEDLTQLRLIDNKTGDDIIVSDPGDDADSAVLAPDGESVAYIDYSEEGGLIGLVLYDVATKTRDRFPRPAEAGTLPMVIALIEGGTVIVLAGGEGATAPIVLVDTESNDVEALDISALCREDGERVEGCTSTLFDFAVSRDGGSIVFGEARTCNEDDAECEPAAGLFIYSMADGVTSEVTPPDEVSPGMDLEVSDGGTFALLGCWLIEVATGDAEWISVLPDGSETTTCSQATMTPDAKFVAFTPIGPQGPGANGIDLAIFVRDIAGGTTTIGTLPDWDGQLSDYTYQPFLSDDGQRLAFASAATNLIGDDKDREDDVFVTTWFQYSLVAPGVAHQVP